MDLITAFFGRFHPLLVHLPIGILFLAFLFECLSFGVANRRLRKAVQPALLVGVIFSIAAAISGYFLRQEGGYEGAIADLHQNFGIATAVLCLLVYILRPRMKSWVENPRKRKIARLALFAPLILALTITGHWGGSLTHGEDYLFAAISLDGRNIKDPTEKIRAIDSVEQAVLYDAVIQPILEARCYDCHSASKQKGDLRLDSKEFILRGGKEGLVIEEGPADSSSLYKRLILPLEHEDHMPPNEKPQLSSSEIALIQYWIEDNAHFSKTVAEFSSDAKISAIIRSLQEAPQQSWIPTSTVDAADENTLRRLRDLAITPMPIAIDQNHLMVSFAGQRHPTDEQLRSLREIEEQLVWINLGHTDVGDAQMDALAQLRNLRVVYLNDTKVTDAGISRLKTLSNLRWLNIVHTPTTDACVETLLGLKNLSALFVYGSGLTREGIRKLVQTSRELKVDTGNYRLEKLPTDTIVYERASFRP